jgi:hypothetical protein
MMPSNYVDGAGWISDDSSLYGAAVVGSSVAIFVMTTDFYIKATMG